jgi:hypothetical protein
MYWQNKVSWSLALASYTTYEVMEDGQVTFGDTPEIIGGTVGIATIWYPELRVASAAVLAPYLVPVAAAVAVPVAVGTITSAAIAGPEGVEDFFEFITEPGEMIDRTVESVQIVSEEFIEPKLRDVTTGLEVIAHMVETNVKKAITWLDNRLPKVRWSNPLPFRF